MGTIFFKKGKDGPKKSTNFLKRIKNTDQFSHFLKKAAVALN